MAAAVGIGRFIYTPILPGMVEDLHLTKGQAGLIAAANFLGYLAGALAAATGRGRGIARPLLLVALAVSAGTTGVMAMATEMAELLGWRFAGGAASASARATGRACDACQPICRHKAIMSSASTGRGTWRSDSLALLRK